jgi:two-component system, sensor histidine kinase FlrB
VIRVDSGLQTGTELGLEAAMRTLSSISATLSESYAALERRTARIERELERKVSELDAVTQHLEAVLDALPSGVIVRDGAGRVVRVNDAALSILGARDAELLGSLDHALLDDSGAQTCADGWRQRVLEGPGDTRRVLASRRSPMSGGGSVEIIDDRTALFELSERLHGLDKLAALGNMAGGIAHELRNPMHASAGFAALLERRLAAGTQERHYAQRVAQGLAEAESVLASMLTLAAPERLVPETIDPAALLEDAVESALSPYVLEGMPSPWKVERNVSAPSFRGDRIKLRLALRNLIANAVEIQPGGGRVAVRLERRGDEICLSVGDAGPGVRPELHGRVLEPFFTTRAEGTGLGLALVATIADLHGGAVQLSPRPDVLGGASFTISFPYRPSGS